MIPPFAISFSSSLRTRTRSCRGVIFTVIIFDLRSIRYKTSRPILRAENLPILLPRRFEVVRLLFLTLGFSLRPLLFVEFHSFRNGNFSFSIRSLRINDQPQNITERRSNKIEGIL